MLYKPVKMVMGDNKHTVPLSHSKIYKVKCIKPMTDWRDSSVVCTKMHIIRIRSNTCQWNYYAPKDILA